MPLSLNKHTGAKMAERHDHAESFDDNDIHYTLTNDKYTYDAEVMVVTIGDSVALVGVPAELFVELGLAIKNGSPYPMTFINSLANGSIGYMPDRKAKVRAGMAAPRVVSRARAISSWTQQFANYWRTALSHRRSSNNQRDQTLPAWPDLPLNRRDHSRPRLYPRLG